MGNKVRHSRGQTVTCLQNMAWGEGGGGFVRRSRSRLMSNEDKEIGGTGKEERRMARQKQIERQGEEGEEGEEGEGFSGGWRQTHAASISSNYILAS